MSLSFNDVSFGWKSYILTCAWLGIGLGVAADSIFATVIFWALGATVGWLAAPRVRQRGWGVITRPLRYTLAVALIIPALGLAVLALEPSEYRKNQIVFAAALGFVAAIILDHRAVFGFFRTPIGLRHTDGERPVEQPRNRPVLKPKTRDRTLCPQCGQLGLVQISQGGLRCKCGYKSSTIQGPGDGDAAPASTSDIEVLDTSDEALARHGELAPSVKLVNVILISAIEKGATHIRIEPHADKLLVRYRIDGVFHDIMQPPLKMRDVIASRIKLMAKLDVLERHVSQHGRMTVRLRNHDGAENIEMHVSCHATGLGENILVSLPGYDDGV